jgi:SAM-dependent methyltransferase
VIHKRTTCRSCGGARLAPILDLGAVPLANAYLTHEQLAQPEPKFPLEVYFCEDCALLQLLHVVSPEALFSNYLYRTGTNQTIAAHNTALARAVTDHGRLGAPDLVVEVASNDGSLLSCFRKLGVRVLGIEPARNIAEIAREAGIETVNEFFGPAVAERVVAQHGPAAAVLANNVLAHVDGTVEFLASCRRLLRPNGRVVIEAPYLVEMLERVEYDTVYHEHLCYFSVTALLRLFAEAGLALDRMDRVEIHGGSLRMWARAGDGAGHSAAVLEMAAQEKARGLASLAAYLSFAGRVQRQREQLVGLLHKLKKEGKRVAGYGAPAKGNTLLCYCGIGADLIPYTVDRSPLKVGRYTPGSRIPILPVARLSEDPPDYILILAWNFAPEIMADLRWFRERGGRFILPIPEPTIV